eukprot:CAMPEP_0168394924 /NCGR_PEP_ID=MMETSP0228-20121227/19783_1 /TAXON_ID=133427 /ORGANISM="Protoceratium reticulatum, Strain CCCM 535 (=CCMP 1889)" /LENGTH=178 /DNA_ID=CAMNT_0008408349 /DNA_START=48 /DNA_END=581 /DNA_ORIENTATION=+
MSIPPPAGPFGSTYTYDGAAAPPLGPDRAFSSGMDMWPPRPLPQPMGPGVPSTLLPASCSSIPPPPLGADPFGPGGYATMSGPLSRSQDLSGMAPPDSLGALPPPSMPRGSMTPRGSYTPSGIMTPPGSMPPGSFPPGAMSYGMPPPGSFQPDAFQPSTMPPGAFTPGSMPPGSMPPG